jgi:hypothetical protein
VIQIDDAMGSWSVITGTQAAITFTLERNEGTVAITKRAVNIL